MESKYARQIALERFGEQSVGKFAAARVAVFGAGGVGSAALPLLAGAGVGRIDIVDCDVVGVSNLHRQTLYLQSQVGLSKAEAAAERLRALNPDALVVPHDERIENSVRAAELLENADLCLDATDSFAARIAISEACVQARVREIVCCAAGFVSQMFLLGANVRFADIVCDPAAEEELSQGLPIFGPAAHLSGVWGAGEALKILAGASEFREGYMQSFDFLKGTFFSFTLNLK